METAASFEARFAPSSYPTGPLGYRSQLLEWQCATGFTVLTQSRTERVTAECTKGRRQLMCCEGHAWCWLNSSDTREGIT
jgi:hypothetical protein